MISGAAGAILGLLALHEATGDASALMAAEAAGLHLVECAAATEAGPKAWNGRSPRALTGMSHGAAGIAYALLRLYGATGERRYLDAAAEGIAYEACVFSKRDGRWPDLRAPGSAASHASPRTSWCHGAPGIGLARLGGLCHLDGPDIRRDIETAIATTRAACFGPLDHLCCGVFGRVETLLVAATVLGRADLREEAVGNAAGTLDRGFCVGHSAPELAPGLFRGIAGIGYQFLRLAYPDAVPSVLLWG